MARIDQGSNHVKNPAETKTSRFNLCFECVPIKDVELNTLREALTDQQLDERLLQLELENTTLRSRVALLESGEYPRLEKTQVQAIEAAHKSALKELNKRRKWCKEIISTIAENTGQRPQELMVFLLSQNGTLT